MSSSDQHWQDCLAQVARLAQASELFGQVQAHGHRLACKARAAHAWYFVEAAGPRQAWVGLYTPDRWLSHSIEADLLHTGDDLEELLEEELADQGLALRPAVEHFRDPEQRYTFRSSVEVPLAGPLAPAEHLARVLLAYHAALSQLGDLAGPAQDD